MFFLPMLPIFFVPLLSGFSSGGSFPKPLAKEKEQQLLLRLRDGTDAEKESAKQTLILHNLRLVAHIAKKYNNAQRESEELISIAPAGYSSSCTQATKRYGCLDFSIANIRRTNFFVA